MSNKLTPRWNPRCDKVIHQCEYFTLVETRATTNKLGYYNPSCGIRITHKSRCHRTTYAHEYVHMVEKHNKKNDPASEYLAHRVSALLAKHYGWSGIRSALRGTNRWRRNLNDNEICQLKARAKKLAQSFLADKNFQEGVKLLESME